MKRFHGWEPRTLFEYDDDGRLLASTVEPEWDEAEQTAMLGLLAYRAGLCPLCGGPQGKCTDPANERKYQGGLPIRCHATTARMVAMEPYLKTPNSQALMVAPILAD